MRFQKKSWFWLFLLILISLLPLLDFFRPGLPITHDGQDHVARIANFYRSLSEGNLVPRWAANLNWGFGHPILMFLYPLPSYLASFFHFLGFSLVVSTKIVFGLSFILSGIFMFWWIKEIWGQKAGFVAGLVYMLSPYRLVDLYVRGAIGECWAFVWPPLVCYFALKLSQELKWRYLVGGSLSLSALILSHNALSLMFLPFVVGYMVYLAFLTKKKTSSVVYYLLLIFFGLTLAAFFWLPAFFEGKYTLREIVTKGNISGFESLSRLLWSDWNYGITGQFSVQLGVLQWLMVLIGPFLVWFFWKKKNQAWRFLLVLELVFAAAIFLILPFSKPLYGLLSLLQKFQFAWRFLSLAVLPPAVLAGALVYLIPKRSRLALVFLLVLAALFLNFSYWRAKGFLIKEESFYTAYYPSPTDTGESAPRWSVRFMEHYPETSLALIQGGAQIKEISRQANDHQYQVNVQSRSRLVENTLYFPNWQVLVDDQLTEVEFQDPNYRGLMTFWVPEGEHQVTVRFRETKLRMLANLISLLALVGLLSGGKIVSKALHEKT